MSAHGQHPVTPPPDAPAVAEREAVRRERAAFVRGMFSPYMHDAAAIVAKAGRHHPHGETAFVAHATEAAAILYPLPTVTRPREVADPNGAAVVWRVAPDPDRTYVEVSWNNGRDWSVAAPQWKDDRALSMTPERVALWADLFANPTEQVPDDA